MSIIINQKTKYSFSRQYVPYILAVAFLIILGWLLSTISDDPARAWLTLTIGGLFLLAAVLVLKTSFSLVNVFFSLSLVTYFVTAMIGLLSYIDSTYRFLYPIGAFFYVIAPLGMYLSSKIMLHIDQDWFTSDIVYILLLTLLLAFAGIFLYDLNSGPVILFGDTLTSFLLALIAFNFFQIRKESDDSKLVFNILILGFIIAFSGLMFNNFTKIVFEESTFLRWGIPTLGMVFVVFSFLALPSHYIQSDDVELHSRINHFDKLLENVVPKLQKHFLPSETQSKASIDNLHSNTDLDQIKVSNEQTEIFKQHLLDEMNGITISILIETALAFPQGITNITLQKNLKKSKTTILDQTKKLISLGYLSKSLNLSDTRKKPLIITQTGFLFLHQLHQILSEYLSKKDSLSPDSSSIYDLHVILEEAKV